MAALPQCLAPYCGGPRQKHPPSAWLVCCNSAWAASHSVPGACAAEVHELKAIRDALAAIAPTKAIWKLHPTDLISLKERNVSLDIPANVMVMPFAPQNSLLGHPKLRAFLTQAGTNSFLEASCVYRVPPRVLQLQPA